MGTTPCGELLTAIPCIEGEDTTPTVDPSSAMMRNLLPLAGSSLVLPSEGVYVGDGVPLVPQKLAERGGYVEMGELLPEFWSAPNEEARKEVKGCRTRKVTDIFTWLQCSASYVAVRVTMTPRLAPELRAYQSTIVRVSQDFVGLQGRSQHEA